MYLALHQAGGFLGLDRKVEVDGDVLTVTDSGGTSKEFRIEDDQKMELENLAKLVLAQVDVGNSASRTLSSDSIETAVEIRTDEENRTFDLGTGDEALPELWALIGKLSEVSSD